MVGKRVIAGAAFTVFILGGQGANSALHDASTDRLAFASLYQNPGARFTVAGVGNTTLLIETAPPGTLECAVALDTIAADRAFIDDISARGFNAIECFAYDDALQIVSHEKRKIVKAPPAKPFNKMRDDRSLAVA